MLLPSDEPGVVRFGQGEGPFAFYERVVHLGSDGSVIDGTVRLRLGLPVVGLLLDPPLRRLLGRPGDDPRFAWWLPPARLTRAAAVVLLAVCCIEVLIGFVAELPGYTMAYAGSGLGAGRAGQGVALGVLQLSAAVALPGLALADRGRRRRRPVTAGLVVAGTATASAALAPGITTFVVATVIAGAGAAVAAVLAGVVLVERMPDGARAWSVGVAGMCVGLGGGGAVAVIPLAGAGPSGWRWCYALAAMAVPAALVLSRWLPVAGGPTVGADPNDVGARPVGWGRRGRGRLALLAAGAVLLAVFSAPAGALQVGYLRAERHLSPVAISVLLQATGTIGGLGTLVGGRLADTRGRRPVASVGVAALAATTVAVYATGGAGLWVAEALSSAVSYAIAPALAVYGAELFPAGQRGRAGGILTVAAAAAGLAATAWAGWVSSRTGSTLPAIAVLATGPLLLAGLVWRAYPETAGRPLDEISAPITG